ncbi:MAG: hypothetical protein ACP5TH_00775 [Fervidicoccaceae archaeon]
MKCSIAESKNSPVPHEMSRTFGLSSLGSLERSSSLRLLRVKNCPILFL